MKNIVYILMLALVLPGTSFAQVGTITSTEAESTGGATRLELRGESSVGANQAPPSDTPPAGPRGVDDDNDGTENTSEDSAPSRVQYNETDFDFVQRFEGGFSSKRVQVRGWDPEKKKEFLSSVKLHAEVSSGQDLENFAGGVLLRDDNVDSVKADEDKVEVTYKMPSRFMGVFSSSLMVKAQVITDEDGNRVKVKYPWYRVFYKVNADLKAKALLQKILPEINDEVLVGFESGAEARAKLQAQARVIEILSVVLKASVGT